MKGSGIEHQLQEIVKGIMLEYVHTGTVDSVEEHDSYGYLLNITLRPYNRAIQARFCHLGAGDGKGIFWPVEADDEVLVLLPGGDPNRAIAFPGLVSEPAPLPTSWTNNEVAVVHPEGMSVRKDEADDLQGFIHSKDFMSDMKDALTEINSILLALKALTPTGTLADGGTVMTACDAYDPTGKVADFITNLGTSIATDEGQDPYISDSLRAS